MRCLAALALTLGLLGAVVGNQPETGQWVEDWDHASTEDCTYAENTHYNATVLMLDVNSWVSTPLVGSANDCCEQCKQFPFGCNTYAYCPDPQGCGSGCKAVASNEGAFGLGPNTNCTADDKFPQYTCTLMVSQTPKNPATYGDGPQTKWSGGAIPY